MFGYFCPREIVKRGTYEDIQVWRGVGEECRRGKKSGGYCGTGGGGAGRGGVRHGEDDEFAGNAVRRLFPQAGRH